MSIKTELKKLYTAMIGGNTTKDGTAAIIGDIADNYTGGGGSGGGAAFVVTAAIVDGEGASFVLGNISATVAEMEQAATENKTIILKIPADESGNSPMLLACGGISEDTAQFFSIVEVDENEKAIILAKITDDNGSTAGTVALSPMTDASEYAPLYVNIEYSADEYTASETPADIAEAYKNGRSVYFVYDKYIMPLQEINVVNDTVDEIYASYTGFRALAGEINERYIHYYAGSGWDYGTLGSGLIPSANPALNGKIIACVNGAWDAVKPQIGYVFDFAVTESEGVYTVTPAEGVTAGAMAATLENTPCVYARLTNAAENTVYYMRVNRVAGTSVKALRASEVMFEGGIVTPTTKVFNFQFDAVGGAILKVATVTTT